MVVDNEVKDEDASAESPTSVLEDEVIFCLFFFLLLFGSLDNVVMLFVRGSV